MVAKCSSRALALLLALPSAAFALGLGDIHLLSPLNAPLNAEIELVDVAPDEVNVQAQLASRETFARYGLEWPAYLTGVQVRTERTGDGRQVIRLKSTDAISEPFVTLLVEVNWSRGRLVREYTMLLDPPVPRLRAYARETVISEKSIVMAGEGPPSTSHGPRFHKDVDADLRRHDASAAATGQYLGPLVSALSRPCSPPPQICPTIRRRCN